MTVRGVRCYVVLEMILSDDDDDIRRLDLHKPNRNSSVQVVSVYNG
jgi:hypothetical protein